ncbi:Replication gene A protein [Salmonella enterica subsp. enterica serovar Alachua str. R6-377]|uniref:Replication gene A protein n=1 Tax=Salmonella enterica subsp. enterica serovar Alachua str. R6-377 TaxID=913241 RepID=G5LKE4_SALET|nr:Replication gene A protein [Salmonella enterica subsp. enterica serovar Alachua str. R6-377]
MAVSKFTLHNAPTTGGSNEAAVVFPWNTPKKAVNPYLDPAEVAPESALSNLIALYAADNEQEQLRRESLSDEVWERYFFNESRDPVQREIEQDRLISHAKTAREQQRFNPDLVIIADVGAPDLVIIADVGAPNRRTSASRYLNGLNISIAWAEQKLIPATCAKQSGRVLSGWSACVTARCLRLSGSWRATTGWRGCWYSLK